MIEEQDKELEIVPNPKNSRVKKQGVDIVWFEGDINLYTDYKIASKIKVYEGREKWEQYYIGSFIGGQGYPEHFNDSPEPVLRLESLIPTRKFVEELKERGIELPWYHVAARDNALWILPDGNIATYDELEPKHMIVYRRASHLEGGDPIIRFTSKERFMRWYKPCGKSRAEKIVQQRAQKIKIDNLKRKYLKEAIEEAEKIYGKSVKTRYYDCGEKVTNLSLQFFRKTKEKIGKPLKIECVYLRKGRPIVYNTRIGGTDGEILLSGCNCGYSGEGPYGLYQILWELDVETRRYEESPIVAHDRIVYTYVEDHWDVKCPSE